MRILSTGLPENDIKILLDASLGDVSHFHDPAKIIVITDENIFSLHADKIKAFPVILTKSGEQHKTQAAADNIISQLLEKNIDKSWLILGVGGGVVTDIAGYVSSIYKRGIKLGLVPTTILGMTDAALGGKNGVNVSVFKNMVGTVYRPQFVLYDQRFLESLPLSEWINGFAEIIKHACIKDAAMFEELSQHSIEYYLQNRSAFLILIEKNIAIKNAVVVNDEHESGDRYLLNFGHTFGHAIENICSLPHGHAISIGMVMAAKLSEQLAGFDPMLTGKLANLLKQFGLPVTLNADPEKLYSLLVKDKKADGDAVNFVLLKTIGSAFSQKISFDTVRELTGKVC